MLRPPETRLSHRVTFVEATKEGGSKGCAPTRYKTRKKGPEAGAGPRGLLIARQSKGFQYKRTGRQNRDAEWLLRHYWSPLR